MPCVELDTPRTLRAAAQRSALALLASSSVWLAPLASALARPGAGDTFSGPDFGGGPDGGGDGHGGDGVELVLFLLRLILMYPKVGLPLAIVCVVLFVVLSRKQALTSWETPHLPHAVRAPLRSRPEPRTPEAGLAQLRALDRDFSRVLFEDFAYRLYASVQRARGQRAPLDALAPYLADDVREALTRDAGAGVEQALVGALRLEHVKVPAGSASEPTAQVEVQLLYEANVRQRQRERMRTAYLRERWTLRRAVDARTKPPGQYERLGCPNCAAPFESTDHRRCSFCHQVVSDGRFNWQLVRREVLSEQDVLGGLGQQVQERGTDKPPVYAPDLAARWSALTTRDPAVTDAALQARAGMIFRELNQAWSEQSLATVRGLVSDGLYDYLNYWVEAYRSAGLRNVLEDMHIELCQRVKVIEDRYFDAVTLRIYASGLDYTVRGDSGERVSGSNSSPRRYSEYWTLIRGSAVRGPARSDTSCPNCAAPLKVSMTGTCEYCAAHITQGEFDWVLSKIEQDDVYDG